MKQTSNTNSTQHTVTKSIGAHIQDPDLMVRAFRTMFSKPPVATCLRMYEDVRKGDRRDAELMRRLTELQTFHAEEGNYGIDHAPTAQFLAATQAAQTDLFYDTEAF